MDLRLGLPVESALPELARALDERGVAVLTAPPGAGKTTLVPLALMDAAWATGKIVMLEPRRLAARAAAERMASLLGESVGQTVGFRIRGEAKTSKTTKIEVVTEGILTRMLQSDPELIGVSAVIFDEFHERSIHADLGIALTTETRTLREDLRLLVMSATLDAGQVAELLQAETIVSEGRAFPVETIYADAPRGDRRLEDAVAALIERAMAEQEGDILVFLPGVAEIERTRRALRAPHAEVQALHGALPFRDQRAALAPATRRKIVLSTAIAETSLTVEGVRVVVDAGLARRARFDPGTAMSRLVTERAARAEADQRRGRAGRVAPGVCYRLWTKGEEGAMPPFAPPEITVADLAPLALELANWGAEAADLAFLDQPPEGALEGARRVLADIGALDGAGRITAHGRRVAAAPTHPRLAHMILSAQAHEQAAAAEIAALLEIRDPLRSAGLDIAKRLNSKEPAMRGIREDGRRLAKRMNLPKGGTAAPGPLVARAYPDRIALRRKGGDARYLMTGGRGGIAPNEDALSGERFLAIADLDGRGRDARIRLAAPLTRGEIEDIYGAAMAWSETAEWSKRDRKVLARRRLMLGAIALEDQTWAGAPVEALAAAMTEGVRQLGLSALPWSRSATLLRARAEWARRGGAKLPDFSDEGLLTTLDIWLTPHLGDRRTEADLASLDLTSILMGELGWDEQQTLNRAAPDAFTAPTGTRARIDYDGAQPSIAIRLQELFGLDAHPTAANQPLLVELLSPAGRPVQTTSDLPGFWRSSYADVRKDLRGRYPKHPWPEDPLTAVPTRRAKLRNTPK